jgi:hypothetical protein
MTAASALTCYKTIHHRDLWRCRCQDTVDRMRSAAEDVTTRTTFARPALPDSIYRFTIADCRGKLERHAMQACRRGCV